MKKTLIALHRFKCHIGLHGFKRRQHAVRKSRFTMAKAKKQQQQIP
jgi:hypothetical protein